LWFLSGIPWLRVAANKEAFCILINSSKQMHLYLWYPLLQAQWDRCDQRNHQI
jgi:hypothetical protein